MEYVTKVSRELLESKQTNARNILEARKTKIIKGPDYYKRHAIICHEPIFVGAVDDIGTARCRANHYSSLLDFFDEQEQKKLAGSIIE